MKIKVDIVSGFLGAGKTTLIKKLITEGLKDEKIFVLENEFGKVGIDGTILRESNIKVKELSSGCICCSPLLDFMKAITEEAEEFRPSRIIVEPTGVALLSEVIAQFNDKSYKNLIELNIIATVVDVKKYELYMRLRPEFFENQIRTAKVLVLSKVDTTEKSQLEEVITSLRAINPKASVICDKWEEVNGLDLINILEERPEGMVINRIRKPAVLINKEQKQIISAEEAFTTFEFVLRNNFSEEELLELLEKLKDEKEFGTVLRGKGIAEGNSGVKYKFDYVSGDINLEEFPSEAEARICFIGIDLNKKALEMLVRK